LAGVGLVDWLMGVVGVMSRAMPWRGSGFTDQFYWSGHLVVIPACRQAGVKSQASFVVINCH
jgi:hypothetical protein